MSKTPTSTAAQAVQADLTKGAAPKAAPVSQEDFDALKKRVAALERANDGRRMIRAED